MTTKNLEKMKKRNASRAGSVSGRASKYTKWLMLSVLTMMCIGVGLHFAGLLAPGMARFTYESQ